MGTVFKGEGIQASPRNSLPSLLMLAMGDWCQENGCDVWVSSSNLNYEVTLRKETKGRKCRRRSLKNSESLITMEMTFWL